MNNLKFRVWDKKIQILGTVSNIDFEYEEVTFYIDDEEELETCQPFEDVELMQSTGFHDKNGVEIFEGDVLNCGYLFTGSPFEEEDEYEEEKGVVKFLNCGFNIEFKNCNALFIDIMLNYEDIEVIGNIHENKELLENDR
jgi:hypothetical protein|nr:MAG TPA: YopX protein [Caudoviricetes sp.]